MTLISKLLGGTGAVLMLASIAAPAQAITPLYSGGGTLAEKVYRDLFNCYGNHSGGDTTVGLTGAPTGCNAVTPYNATVEALYVGVGSGNGKKAFINHDASKFTDGPRKPDAAPVPSTSDFGPFYGPDTGAAWPATRDGTDSGPFPGKVSFVGSDDPLTVTDLTTYNTNLNNWGQAIQVPGLITTITVPFHQTATWTENGTVVLGSSSNVNLSTDTLCGIFTGVITDWSDNAFKAANGGVALGNGPITVVYRNDGSGSTFLFTNALLNQCASTTHPIPAQWIADNGGSTTVSNNNFFINVNNAGHIPANFVGAAGSGGVQTAITGTVGAVGYLSPDFVLPVVTGGLKTANLQIWTTVGHTAKFVAPTPANGTLTVGPAKPPSSKIDAINCPTGSGFGQSPDNICSHNPLNWGLTFPKPLSSKAYPIGGFTFIDAYTCYAATADRDALAKTTVGSFGLFRWLFDSTNTQAKTELTNNGFSPIPNSWYGAAKKLLTTDAKAKIGIPNQLKTGCAAVTGSGA